MYKVTEDHRGWEIVQRVIEPSVSSVVYHMSKVDGIDFEVWDAYEATTDYHNEYVLLAHLVIHVVDDEPLDSDLGRDIALCLADLAGQYYEDLDEGDFIIEIKEPWLMNSSIVLPITMQK